MKPDIDTPAESDKASEVALVIGGTALTAGAAWAFGPPGLLMALGVLGTAMSVSFHVEARVRELAPPKEGELSGYLTKMAAWLREIPRDAPSDMRREAEEAARDMEKAARAAAHLESGKAGA